MSNISRVLVAGLRMPARRSALLCPAPLPSPPVREAADPRACLQVAARHSISVCLSPVSTPCGGSSSSSDTPALCACDSDADADADVAPVASSSERRPLIASSGSGSAASGEGRGGSARNDSAAHAHSDCGSCGSARQRVMGRRGRGQRGARRGAGWQRANRCPVRRPAPRCSARPRLASPCEVATSSEWVAAAASSCDAM